jgi:hypothetical protein
MSQKHTIKTLQAAVEDLTQMHYESLAREQELSKRLKREVAGHKDALDSLYKVNEKLTEARAEQSKDQAKIAKFWAKSWFMAMGQRSHICPDLAVAQSSSYADASTKLYMKRLKEGPR